jgi:hypothetical protein
VTEAPILFEDFVPGLEIGRSVEIVSSQQARDWTALYPWDPPIDGRAPAGMATVLMMKAYLGLVTPRPPGNLHVQQRMRVYDGIPIEEDIIATVACQSKEMRKGRRVVELLSMGKDRHDRRLYEGLMTLYWAA